MGLAGTQPNSSILKKAMGARYEFTNEWFARNIPVWAGLFCGPNKPKLSRYLEIGSYEGESVAWAIKNIFQRGELHCVDTWSGGREHFSVDMTKVESRFDKNLELAASEFPQCSVHKHKGKSVDILSAMIAGGKKNYFDLIYIDGSHEAPDVLSDLVLSFALCKVGGIIICDDYIWSTGDDIRLTPKLAIDSFINCHSRKISIIPNAPLWQIYFQKRSD